VKSDLLYLHHIRERCGQVHECVHAGRDAVMRNLEITGEAAK